MKCAVEWDILTVDEAAFMGEILSEAAGMDEKLSKEEAGRALGLIESDSDDGPYDGPVYDCDQAPETLDGVAPEAIFDAIDADGDGNINEGEGMAGLACGVRQGYWSEEDAYMLGDYLSHAAGADGKLNKEEAQAAMDALDKKKKKDDKKKGKKGGKKEKK